MTKTAFAQEFLIVSAFPEYIPHYIDENGMTLVKKVNDITYIASLPAGSEKPELNMLATAYTAEKAENSINYAFLNEDEQKIVSDWRKSQLSVKALKN